MSHVRNLLQAPPRHVPEAVFAGPISHLAHSAPIAGPQPVPVPVREEALPEFPVEQARIQPESRMVYHTDPRSPAADRFRFLRMRLREFAKDGKLKRLLVTSPTAGDGKTTAILNL